MSEPPESRTTGPNHSDVEESPQTLWAEHLVVFGICLAAATWAIFRVGVLGFHFEDLSIPWDGGYRILSGQRPFVDFFAPIGPVLFLQQALFFYLFGVGLVGFLAHAAVLDAVAGFVVWTLLRPYGRAEAAAGTLITLAWFYLPPGAPYIDTTAFFWLLLALRCAIAGKGVAGSGRLVAAGACAAVAFLTKQNIGGIGGVGIGLFLLLEKRQLRPAFLFSLGVSLPLLSFAAYLSVVGGWASYLQYFWQIPLESGRLKYLTPWLARMAIKLLQPELIQSTYADLLGPALREIAVYGSCLFLAWRYRLESGASRHLLAATGLVLLLQQWSFNTSNNDEALYWPFLGLIVGWLAAWAGARRRVSGRWFPGLVLSVLTVLCVAAGWNLSRSRTIHSLHTDQLTTRLEHPRLQGLWLRHPEGEDFVKVLDHLTRHRTVGESFFVLGHTSLLYGATGSPSPQPLLWFRPGVSYSADNNTTTDDAIVTALERNRVRWIFIDPLAGDELLDDFPGIARLLAERYLPVPEDLGAWRAFRRVG